MSPSKKPGGNGKKSLAAESGLDDSALESVVGGVAAPAIAKIAEGFEHAAQAVAAIHIAPDAHAVVTAHSSPIDTVAGSQHAAPGPVATVHSSPIDTVGGHGPVVGVSSDPIAGGHPAAPGPADNTPGDGTSLSRMKNASARRKWFLIAMSPAKMYTLPGEFASACQCGRAGTFRARRRAILRSR